MARSLRVTMSITISGMCFPGRPTAEENRATAAAYLDEAARRGSDIVCLPESFAHRRGEVVESLDGPSVSMARQKARQHSMYVIAPIMEQSDGGVYNTAALIDRRGEMVGVYRKVHPTEGELANGVVPGADLPVFDTDCGRIAILTCYDHDWPEMFAAYRRQGARIIFWPTMVYGYTEFDNDIRKASVCFDYGLYLVSANYYHWSDPAPVRDYRHTFIMSPEGIALANSGYKAGVITAHIDLDSLWPARDAADARPQAWTDILEPYRRPDLYAVMMVAPAISQAGHAQRRLRVAALNLPEAAAPGEPAPALAAIGELLPEAGQADLAVLPENCLYGGAAEEEASPTPATGEQIAALAGLARSRRLWLAAPVYREEGKTRVASVLLFDAEGRLAAVYNKTHLSRNEAERHGVQAGDSLPVFDTPVGRLGLLLGRDIFYPEAYALLALQGAELILWGGSPYPFYPTAYQMRHVLASRPLTYSVPLAAAMWGGRRPFPSAKLQRSSVIIDHFGDVLADSGPCPGMAQATLSLPPQYHYPAQDTRWRAQFGRQAARSAWT